jgi:hypothetical protein
MESRSGSEVRAALLTMARKELRKKESYLEIISSGGLPSGPDAAFRVLRERGGAGDLSLAVS